MRGGHVDVDGLDIIAADARGEKERPHGYGVYVLHGAFTRVTGGFVAAGGGFDKG